MVTEESTKDTVKTIVQGMPAVAVYPWLLTRVLFAAQAATGATRIRHSLRPLMISRAARFQQLGRFAPRDCGCMSPLTPSLRGANGSRECAPDDRLRDEAIQSRVRGPGLLRGACHPAALCADRVARNDDLMLALPNVHVGQPDQSRRFLENEIGRNASEHGGEPPLGFEPLPEGGGGKRLLEAKQDSAGDIDSAQCADGQREIAGHAAQEFAESRESSDAGIVRLVHGTLRHISR